MSPIDPLIDCLRKELEHYGEMLVLLDEQQEAVVRCQPDHIVGSASAIDAQGEAIQRVRETREAAHRAVAHALNQAASDNLFDLVPELPAAYRPLVDALVQENNQLLARIQQRARQNQVLLKRSLETLQQVIGSLCAPPTPRLYGETGRVIQVPAFSHALCEAVG